MPRSNWKALRHTLYEGYNKRGVDNDSFELIRFMNLNAPALYINYIHYYAKGMIDGLHQAIVSSKSSQLF